MHEGSDGTALRGMYADFLTEAASILNSPALDDAAAEYRALGAKWRAFADTALDPSVPLASACAVLDQREAAIKIGGDDQADTIVALGKELEASAQARTPTFRVTRRGSATSLHGCRPAQRHLCA